MDLEANKSRAVAFMLDFARTGNVDRSRFADDATWWTLSTGFLPIDLYAKRAGQMAATRYAGPGRFEIEDVMAEGDRVVVEGKGHQPLREGGSYENTYLWLFCFRQDKIASVKVFFDTALAMRTFQPLPN